MTFCPAIFSVMCCCYVVICVFHVSLNAAYGYNSCLTKVSSLLSLWYIVAFVSLTLILLQFQAPVKVSSAGSQWCCCYSYVKHRHVPMSFAEVDILVPVGT